jgi:hypothetical protein
VVRGAIAASKKQAKASLALAIGKVSPSEARAERRLYIIELVGGKLLRPSGLEVICPAPKGRFSFPRYCLLLGDFSFAESEAGIAILYCHDE